MLLTNEHPGRASLLITSFASVINMFVNVLLVEKYETNKYLKHFFIYSHRPGSMVVVCLVQRIAGGTTTA